MSSPKGIKVKGGGIKEAAKILAALDLNSRKNILSIIAKEDSAMAEMLRKNLVSMEDLQKLTPKMLVELLREIKMEDLSLALRISSVELRQHLMSVLPRGPRTELEESLNGKPVPVSKVNEASNRILKVIREKIEKGELVLSDDDQLV